MEYYRPLRSVLTPPPPPLWYVTNGDITVGPVYTGLLKRGVIHGRIPDYCRVRANQTRWRRLDSVREIAALYKRPDSDELRPSEQALLELERAFGRSRRDEDETCHHVARLAQVVTGAESAMVHFRRKPTDSLVTRSVLGPMSDERLDRELSDSDPVVRSALRGRPVLGPPYGPAEDALAIRFASSAGGVGGAAMIPVISEGSLVAMLELSKPGHAFRHSDLLRAERIAQRALFQQAN